MPVEEIRPLPPLQVERQRGYLQGLFKAYAAKRGKLPPPWVLVFEFRDKEDEGIRAAFVALHPIRPSADSEREEPWLIRGVVRLAEAGPHELTRLSIEHFERRDAAVSGYVLHRVPVAAIRGRARLWLSSQETFSDALEESAERKRWARQVAAEAKKKPLRRGRKGRSAEHYRWVAWRAVKLFKDGHRDVIARIAEEEGRPYQTVRDWIRRARSPELGFLAPVGQGQIHFEPGPNLLKDEEA